MLQIKIIIFEFPLIFSVLGQSAKWVEEKYGRFHLEPVINQLAQHQSQTRIPIFLYHFAWE